MQHAKPAALLLIVLPLVTTLAPAQTQSHSQGQGQSQSQTPAISGDLPIDSYLSLLSQVAPAARDGAEAYLAAFHRRCGRPMLTVELRRAFAEGSGDPTLMAMVRAAHQRDTTALQRFGAAVTCRRN